MKQKDKIINAISKHTKLKLKPSKVCDGVGLFVIDKIYKGESIFPDVTQDKTYIGWNEVPNLNQNVKEYLDTMCNSDENGIYLSRTPNNINLSYFVNHSEEPNIYHDLKKDTMVALRDIEIGEEILCVYTEQERSDF